MRAIIYLVTNRANGKRYVGVTRYALAKRWAEHLYSARTKRTRSWLHKAIRKYGEQAFDVHQVASCLRIEDAHAVEREVIQSIAPEYNQTSGGEFTAGRKQRAPQTGARISEALRGKPKSPEAKAAMSAAKRRYYEQNPDARSGVARARQAIDREKQRAAVSAASRARVWSAESRAKLSAARLSKAAGAANIVT